MTLYAIPCRFKIAKDAEVVEGLAICTDPNTPTVFIHPNGEPYTGTEMWYYTLMHYRPWAKLLD